ncbi:MAG: hypothetical protein J6S67_04835 [Methanobrevibacter sp.]|nr:hypothetical protein [Methanobrevibacter sp.]
MNEVTYFMWYIYNRWSHSESIMLFGENLGEHIFEKWMWYRRQSLDSLMWYSELDNECRQKIVDRANEIYGK